MPARPNILLIITDQQRGDCLGIDGHPVLQTPHLDALAAAGARFRRAYSACPLCMPARRTLMTGMSAASHGLVGNTSGVPLDHPTLAERLRDSGYQTHLVGKLHFFPVRRRYGFDSMDWSDGPYKGGGGDYTKFVEREAPPMPRVERAHGATTNSWVARPWHLEDRLHFTNWTTDRALEFLEKRDPTAPFFLKASYFHPHTPSTPPAYYFSHYMNQDLGEPHVGAHSRISEGPIPGLPVRSKRCALSYQQMKQLRAGYFGCIHHIDDQVGRLLEAVPRDTIIVFTSDHGEMLGDHQYFQKGRGFEGASRIPYLIKFPDEMKVEAGQVRDEPVELMDIMPTLLDAVGVDAPREMDGKSLLPLLRGKNRGWREFIHGEAAHRNAGTELEPDISNHFLTDGRRKFVWDSATGQEMFFNLENDPYELENLADQREHSSEVSHWRDQLIIKLRGREERFASGSALRAYGRTPPALVGETLRKYGKQGKGTGDK